MNWQRGLLLAGINLVAVAPLILLLEARDARYVRDREQSGSLPADSHVRVAAIYRRQHARLIVAQEDQTVTLNPCGMWTHDSPQMRVVTFGNLPATTLAEWRQVCPDNWSLSGMLQGEPAWGLTRSRLASQKKIDLALGTMIALQWFLVGSFPLGVPQNGGQRQEGSSQPALSSARASRSFLPSIASRSFQLPCPPFPGSCGSACSSGSQFASSGARSPDYLDHSRNRSPPAFISATPNPLLCW